MSDLIDVEASSPRWDCRKLHTLWHTDIVNRIKDLNLGKEDIQCWKDGPAGSCSFKALYKHMYLRQIGPSFPWKNLWSLKLPSKIKIFSWKLLLDLPTRQRLSRWDSSIQPLCPLCWNAPETVDHLFATCSFVKMLWDLTPSSIQTQTLAGTTGNWFWFRASPAGRRYGCILF